MGDKICVLFNVKFNIFDEGEVIINNNGSYIYIYVLCNNVNFEIFINFFLEKYKMFKLLDGVIMVDFICEEMFIEFVVVNMVEENLEFKKCVNDLEKKIFCF